MTVLGYINHCMDLVAVGKSFQVYPNHKPRTRDVQRLLQERNNTFRSGDGILYTTARANLRRGISKTRPDYRTEMQDQLSSNSIRQIWQGKEHITNYRPNLTTTRGNPLLAGKLNHLNTGTEVIGCKCSRKNHQAL